MITNQLGNTLEVSYPVMVDGQIEDLSQMDVNLYIQCNRFKKKMTTDITGNTIHFYFEGKDQIVAGPYDIIVVINEGVAGQLTLVNKNVFELVRWK